MRFATVAAVVFAGLATAHKAHNGTGDVTVTEIVTGTATIPCTEPTTVTHGTKTWTVTDATTLTITDCPCTVTKTHKKHKTHTKHLSTDPVTTGTGSPSTYPVTSIIPPYPTYNSTTPGSSGSSAGTISYYGTGSPVTPYSPAIQTTNAGAKPFAAAGAGLLALCGMVAAL